MYQFVSNRLAFPHRHTPRLNAFISMVRRLTQELGGGWEILGWFRGEPSRQPQYFFDREEIAAQRAGVNFLEKPYFFWKNTSGF
jgi:hypothetical protein